MTGLSMALELRQKPALTAQLKQSVHVLTLNGSELTAYVKEQAERNPALDMEERRGPYLRPAAGTFRMQDGMKGTVSSGEPMEWEETAPERFLVRQLGQLALPRVVYEAAVFLSGCLDEDGYLRMTLEEAAEAGGYGVTLAADALRQLQSLDPPGIGARNLRECLLLQMERDQDRAPYARELVECCLELLAAGKMDTIAAQLGIGADTLAAAVAYIRKLRPRPWVARGRSDAGVVRPDAFVWIGPDGEAVIAAAEPDFMLSLYESAARPIGLEGSEGALSGGSREAGAFWFAYRQEALWLMRCVRARKETLRRVLAAVMEAQPSFLRHGAAGLRPLRLADIAGATGLHESTVSRAVRGKWIATPNGTIPLKSLFSAELAGEQGSVHSAAAVRERVRLLIAGEDKRRPLSDGQLVSKLAKEGIRLARRTAAKYREQLRIPSSLHRKREMV